MVGYRDLMWSGERRPEVSAAVENGALYLSADCSETVICQADHEVIVSEEIWADIQTGSGDVVLSVVTDSAAAERRLQINSGSGDVEVRGE